VLTTREGAQSSKDIISKSLSSGSSSVVVSKEGKLKLFDDHSKFRQLKITRMLEKNS
jgi:hypothetical protein